ncbi:MAG: methylated-DNA--[protein]-cysteine S-methyltransferase [Lysobacteraceae bacterium]
MSPHYVHRLASPIGPLTLIGDGSALNAILFAVEAQAAPLPVDAIEDAAPFAAAIAQLDAYFAGQRQRFDLPLAPTGTPFQLAVWQALREIPFGATESYAGLARRIGRPGAARAVGAANGRNPLGIVTPCHRVIGADGSLTGFGGGLPAKAWLLRHEAAVLGHEVPDQPSLLG